MPIEIDVEKPSTLCCFAKKILGYISVGFQETSRRRRCDFTDFDFEGVSWTGGGP
jgi:hypothetical protein